MTDMTELERVVAQYIIRVAPEVTGEYETNASENALDSMPPLHDLSPDWIELHDGDEDRGPMIVVGASTTGSVSEQTRSATYNPPGKAHPAEYKNHDVDMSVSVAFYPLDALGTADIHIEQHEHPTAPPAREPYEDRL